jgi:hypothetical protein
MSTEPRYGMRFVYPVANADPIDFNGESKFRKRAARAAHEHLRDLVRAHPGMVPGELLASIRAALAERAGAQ